MPLSLPPMNRRLGMIGGRFRYILCFLDEYDYVCVLEIVRNITMYSKLCASVCLCKYVTMNEVLGLRIQSDYVLVIILRA